MMMLLCGVGIVSVVSLDLILVTLWLSRRILVLTRVCLVPCV